MRKSEGRILLLQLQQGMNPATTPLRENQKNSHGNRVFKSLGKKGPT
jgi:hypothetical protein